MIFSVNKQCWPDWVSKWETLILPFLTPHPKINSRWNIDLSVKDKTAKHLQENIGKYLHKLGTGHNLLDGKQRAQIIKGKNDQLEFIKIKDLCSSKKLLREIKHNPE